MLHIDEEEAPLRSQDQQARNGLVIRVAGRQRAQHILTGLAANHMERRLHRLAGQPQQGGQDRHHYAFQGTEQQHPRQAMTAQRNSIIRICPILRNSPG